MLGAAVCYLVVGFSQNTIVAFVACILTGCFTSMLWPGTLILMEEKISRVGITGYALMAAGGDLGASVAPQLMGIIVDKVSVSTWAGQLSAALSLSTEQVGMKTGMLVAALFPMIGTLLLLVMKRYFKKN